MRLSLAAPLFVAALLLGAGCKSPCRQLAEKLCECSLEDPTVPPSSFERQSCLAIASAHDQEYAPAEADQALCADLLPQCDCTQLETAEGKRACGLAR